MYLRTLALVAFLWLSVPKYKLYTTLSYSLNSLLMITIQQWMLYYSEIEPRLIDYAYVFVDLGLCSVCLHSPAGLCEW